MGSVLSGRKRGKKYRALEARTDPPICSCGLFESYKDLHIPGAFAKCLAGCGFPLDIAPDARSITQGRADCRSWFETMVCSARRSP